MSTAPSVNPQRPPVTDSGLLPVGDGHHIYWEESGDAAGVPCLYLHGGPGGTLGRGGYRDRYPGDARIIGLDQRGCGRSTPNAATPGYPLHQNTTAHLIADIEALRGQLGVEAWVVTGVSWGSTLALAYATAHPERLAGLILFAVTTTRRFETDWITDTVGAIYPEAWDRFAGHARAADPTYARGDGRLVEAYARLLDDPDPAVVDAASLAWADWEDHHVAIGNGGVRPNANFVDPTYRHAFTRLTSTYWAHDAYLDPPLLDRLEGLAAQGVLDAIPAVLIHGRLDVSGPAGTAWEVHRRWPGSRLEIVETEGHGGPLMVELWTAAAAELVAGVQAAAQAARPWRNP